MLLLIFQLDERQFALHLDVVERVVRAVEVTPLPDTPAAVSGVINVFGRLCPVIDLRRRLGLPDKVIDIKDQFIVTHRERRPPGRMGEGAQRRAHHAAPEFATGATHQPDDGPAAPGPSCPSLVALWVDSVVGVVDYPESKVTKTPEILPGIEAIEGIATLDQGIVLFVDLNELYAPLASKGE